MLRPLRRDVPKNSFTATPGRRLDELANKLEERERAVYPGETPEQSERRRADLVLGTPSRAVVLLRRLARHWEARVAAGLGAPKVGRLRKEARAVRKPEHATKLLALARWLRKNRLAEEFLRDTKLFPGLLASFAGGHTTCTCSVCGDRSSEHRICEFAAVCRAAVELDLRMLGGPASAAGELVRAIFEVENALLQAAQQLVGADPDAEARFQRLVQEPLEAGRMLNEPEFSVSYGPEFSVLVLRQVARGLHYYGLNRCSYFGFSPRDVGVAGPGAPERERAAEQHLENGGLQFVKRGPRLEVARLKRRTRKRPEMTDQRIRFIGRKTAT